MNNWNQLLPFNVNTLFVDQQSAGTLLTGAGNGALKSDDNGLTWANMDFGLPSMTIHSLHAVEAAPKTIYGVSSAGIIKSTDNGSSWAILASKGLTGGVASLAIDPTTPDTVYAATNTVLYKSIDGGSSWNEIRTIKDALGDGSWKEIVVVLSIDSTGVVYLRWGAIQEYGYNLPVMSLERSADSGKSWKGILPKNDVQLMLQTSLLLVIDAQTPSVLRILTSPMTSGATQCLLFTSKDSGDTWTSQTVSGLDSRTPSSLISDPECGSSLYAGTQGGGVFKSDDSGLTWSSMNSGLSWSEIHFITLDSQRLFVNTSKFIYRLDMS